MCWKEKLRWSPIKQIKKIEMGSYAEKMRDVQNLSNKNLRKREKMMVEIYQKSAKEIISELKDKNLQI